MEKLMAIYGSNNYKLPHMKKDKAIEDFSSYNVVCKPDCYESALASLAARITRETELEPLLELNYQEE